MFERLCPQCSKVLTYTVKKQRNRAERKKQRCASCAAFEVQNRPEVLAKKSAFRKGLVGKANPFFGHHHTEETKRKILDARILGGNGPWQTVAYRKKMSALSSGVFNPMFGRTFYDVWVKRYGEEEANRRMLDKKKRMSIAFSGDKNPMYGKPAPKGSGGGWSGWYKKWYFRSLRELSYMRQVIEPSGYKWKTAESKKLSIPYVDFDGKHRTYRADFLLDDKILVEVKPLKLMSTPSNVLKRKAAESFCEQRGLEYRLVDSVLIDVNDLKHLCSTGEVVLLAKWQERLSKWK